MYLSFTEWQRVVCEAGGRDPEAVPGPQLRGGGQQLPSLCPVCGAHGEQGLSHGGPGCGVPAHPPGRRQQCPQLHQPGRHPSR
jgi:hypothetical protein